MSATNGVQDVFKTFTLSGNQSAVTLSFTFYRSDTWDGEQFRVWINDTLVSQNAYSQNAIQSYADSTPDTRLGKQPRRLPEMTMFPTTIVINQRFTGTSSRSDLAQP